MRQPIHVALATSIGFTWFLCTALIDSRIEILRTGTIEKQASGQRDVSNHSRIPDTKSAEVCER